ncbi:hypothetical protein HRJ34_15330 [Rhizorhabdus wittichii]|uniref:Uncharacterized protein n=1 Tax=Rhizorhabdus wittichii TaxID=160791 RepID=A0A975HBT7_9SPHN|nr:hypothetical protein [Rhizorhabdus wittichii]QTH19740.1 hypothetical protein HRJ34_15330 [Rhizorhabdus wittichii]
MSRDEQVEARARELVMAAYAEAGMQPQPWFLHDDPASFRGSDYFLFKAIIEALRGASGGGLEETDCETCQGNGEIVLDWDVYLHPPEDAPADAGVADCPDCDGTGKVDAPDHPAENAKSSGEVDEEEAYQIGKRDGFEEAVAHIDRLTGGDGEYFASTIPGRGCPDHETMIRGIVDRFEAQPGEVDGWQPRIGDEVRASEHFLMKYGEWRDQPLWVAGLQACDRGGINVSVSEDWPRNSRSLGLTDGFYINRHGRPNDLVPAAIARSGNGEG